jgi:HK97 family phage portal protein
MGLLVNLFRRSLENPSTPLSAPDDWLFDSLGSFRASSGVNVNRETALTLDTYFRCAALISGDAGKLPLLTYKKTGKGKEIDQDHAAYHLLYEESSEELSALHFKRVLTFHAMCEGNGYSYINRDRAGRPIELWPLSPMKTYPVREGRRLWYVTQFGGGDHLQQRKLPGEDVFHLKGLSFDGLVGYSVVAKMRETLGLAIAYENFGSMFFKNQAVPKAVLVHPGRLKPEAIINLRESWERMHSGLENSHRTAVLQEGMDVKTLTIDAEKSQLMEGKNFSRVQICNFFGVPPHKAGDASRTSYNSLEQENEAYIDDGGGLGYWLAAWEAEARLKLLSDAERETRSHCIAFKKNGMLRANLTARTQYYVSMLQNGVFNPNEVREEEGYNPREGGEEYMVQLNMQPNKAADPADNKPDPPPTPDDKPALPAPGKKQKKPRALLSCHKTLIADATRRMVKRIGVYACKAARKPPEFMQAIDRLVDHRAVIWDALSPAIRAAKGKEDCPCAEVDDLLSALRDDLLEAAGRATAKDLEGEINALADQWEAEWPERMVRQVVGPEGPGEHDPVIIERTIQGMKVAIQVKTGQPQPEGNKSRVSPAVNDYGYLPGIKSNDGRDLDVFVGTDPDNPFVWVIDQLTEDSQFDEHKVLLGFSLVGNVQAEAAYLANYLPPYGARMGGSKGFYIDEFKTWLSTYDPAKPVSWVGAK